MSAANRRLPALWVAIAATVLSLVLPLAADTPGRVLTVRVLLFGAAILIALALTTPTTRTKQRRLVGAALVLIGFTAALVVRGITPSGAILLSIAMGSLLWERRALAPT